MPKVTYVRVVVKMHVGFQVHLVPDCSNEVVFQDDGVCFHAVLSFFGCQPTERDSQSLTCFVEAGKTLHRAVKLHLVVGLQLCGLLA